MSIYIARHVIGRHSTNRSGVQRALDDKINDMAMTWRGISASPCLGEVTLGGLDAGFGGLTPVVLLRAQAQGLTLAHFSAQPEPFLTQNKPKTPLRNP